VCAHPERQAIDRAILAGEAKSVISRRWGIPPDATERHAKVGHVVRHEHIMAGREVLVPREGDNLLDKLEALIEIVRDVMARCIKNNQPMNSLACARELTRIYEFVAKLTGQLDESTRVNVLVQQQQHRDSEQELMLERLTVAERLELRRLVAKAQNGEKTPGVAVSVRANGIVGGDGDGTVAQAEPRSD
jgi:hypothetical protein